MKRFALLVLTLFASFMVVTAVSPSVLAVQVIDKVCDANTPTPTGTLPEFCKDNSAANDENSNPIYGAGGIVTKGIQLFLMIFGIVAVFVMLINAVRMITSMGDPKSFESARNGIIYAAIGIAVAASANIIVSFIVKRL